MPDILIAEDEPAAARYLRSIIELKRPDFRIAGCADNGQDALERIRLRKPDLVITDVKMPVMDGIELAVALKDEFPSLPIVIVSGHQDFEYARRVLDTGVVDYLLKPLNPVQLVEALDRLKIVLDGQSETARAACLLRYIDGDCAASCDDDAAAMADAAATADTAGTAGAPAIAVDELFWVGVVRTGGLPARFRLEPADERGVTSDNGFYSMPGCDSRERIFLGTKKEIPYDSFIERVRLAADREGGEYRTVLILETPARADGLEKAACGACVTVNALIVAGLSRLSFGPGKPVPAEEWDKALADRIEYALMESRSDLLEAAIRDMVAGWEKIRLPLISVESRLRRILYFILRRAPRANGDIASNLEFLLEETVCNARDFAEIRASVWVLVQKAVGAAESDFRDSDVPAFFHAITCFIGEHFAEPLTLGSLSRTFRISASYLSKLFRMHAGHSFVEYLSAIRMEAAKELMLENPALSLKEVSQRIGFSDPLYFSRVFKACTGVPPSGFTRANGVEKTAE